MNQSKIDTERGRNQRKQAELKGREQERREWPGLEKQGRTRNLAAPVLASASSTSPSSPGVELGAEPEGRPLWRSPHPPPRGPPVLSPPPSKLRPWAPGPGFILCFWMSESSEVSGGPGEGERSGTQTKDKITAPPAPQQAWRIISRGVSQRNSLSYR